MTIDTNELRAMLAKATKGEWFAREGFVLTANGCSNQMIANASWKPENAALICAAVNALPALLDHIEALHKYADNIAAEAYSNGYCTAIDDFSIWKDGERRIGSQNKTAREAIKEFMESEIVFRSDIQKPKLKI